MAKIQPTTSAKPAVSTKPTATDKKAKKDREPKADRAVFPLTQSKDPAVYPFKGEWAGEGEARALTRATPEGYDSEKHERLSKKDFEKPSIYMTFRAEQLEAQAKAYRDRAELMRKGGDKKGGAGKANRLIKTMKKVQDLKAELAAAGVDVEALMADALKAAKPAAPATPATGEQAAAPATK